MSGKKNSYDDFQRGLATDLAPNWRDLAKADSGQLPESLTMESSPNLGTGTIPPERYTSHQFHRAEVERLWKRTWQMTCREEEIAGTGDHFVYNVANMSFLIVRVKGDQFKAYWNVCLHRGRRLRDQSGTNAKSFRCGYHSWTWNIDGELAFMPGEWDFPDVQKEKFGLREVQVATWGGFIFINPDMKARPFAEHLGSMGKHFEKWPLDRRFTLWHVQKTIKCNWKIAMEAFLESYHVVETHPQALPAVAEHATQYDIFDEGAAQFNRLITPSAVPSKHSKDPSAIKSIGVAWAVLNGLRDEEASQLPPAIKDRASLAQWRREDLGKMTRSDYSSLSDAEMLDSIQYGLFPNFCPWYGEGLPLTYLFRPNADTPDTCYMDVWMLVRVPDAGPRPPAAKTVFLNSDQAFSSIPELGMMGEIFDQDDANMPYLQIGLNSWPGDPEGCVLGRYQESRIRHFHQVLGKLISQA